MHSAISRVETIFKTAHFYFPSKSRKSAEKYAETAEIIIENRCVKTEKS